MGTEQHQATYACPSDSSRSSSVEHGPDYNPELRRVGELLTDSPQHRLWRQLCAVSGELHSLLARFNQLEQEVKRMPDPQQEIERMLDPRGGLYSRVQRAGR